MPGPYDVVIRDKESIAPPSEEVVHSWAPKKPASAEVKKTSAETSREFIKSFASWVIVVALAIDGLALVFEPLELLRHGAPVSAAIATTLASFGRAAVFSLGAAVPVAAAYSSVRLIGRLHRPWSFTWPVPLALMGWLIVINLAPHPVVTVMSKAAAQWLLLGLLGGLLVLATLVARIEQTTHRLAAGAALMGFMVALSYALPPSIHHEPRDVVWFCLVMCAVSLLYPMRRTMRAASYGYVLRRFGALVIGSLLVSTLVPFISPSWRVYSRDYGAFADRMGRLLREVADVDGDGYSAVFGGTDCDDFDMMRNPGMLELVKGVDRNCNGIVRPEHPSPAELGLAPEVGDPDAVEGEIDRVIVITFDCFRNDAFSPAVTPNLVQLAAKGVSLTKLYAGGSRTALSLPLMWRSAYDRRPAAAVLHAAGITSSGVFAYNHGTLEGNVLDGFEVIQRPPDRDKRFRASEVTDLALADLRDPAHAKKHLLWTHYFDAHGPRAVRFLPPEVTGHAPIAGEGSDSGLYLDELAYDDRELGRLLEGIEQTGDLAKTLIVVSADHGEGFGAHNMYEHGQSAFEELIHVPGVVVAPGLPVGHYDHVLSHRDVVATVLGAFGLAKATPGAEEFGRSWLRLRAAHGAPLHTFVTTYSASAHVFAWEDAPMIARTDDDAKLAVGYLEGIERLYHLRSPAGETRDVDHDFPVEAARDRRELEVYHDIDRPPP